MAILKCALVAYGSYNAIQAILEDVLIPRDIKPVLVLIVAYMAFCTLTGGQL